MDIVVLKQAKRELKSASTDIIQDIFSHLDDRAAGKSLEMPVSKPLPNIAKGLYELRISGKSGNFRVFYVIKVGDAIYILHAASKKTQTISKQTASLLKARLKGINHE